MVWAVANAAGPISDTQIRAAITRETIGRKIHLLSAGEIANSTTIVEWGFKPGHLLRYGENTTPGTTPMAAVLQVAVNSEKVVTLPDETVLLESDVTTTQAVTIIGGNRAASRLTGTGRIVAAHAIAVFNVGFDAGVNAIYISASISSLEVQWCDFDSQTGVAIFADTLTLNLGTLTILNNTFNGRGAGVGGVDLLCGYDTCKFSYNDVREYDSSSGAYAFRGGQNTAQVVKLTILQGNTVEDIQSTGGTGSTYGLQTIRGRSIITDNDIRNIGNLDDDDCEGIYVKGDSAVISNNTLFDAGSKEGQISCKAATHTVCTGNYVFQTIDRDRAPGITIQSSNVICTNNIVVNAYMRGIWVDGGNNPGSVMIRDNQIINTVGDATGSGLAGPTAAVYLATIGGKKTVRGNLIDGVENNTAAGDVAGVFSTGNAASVDISDNNIDVNTILAANVRNIQIASAPVKLRIVTNVLLGNGHGVRTTTTGGVTDLELVGNDFASTLASTVVFNGAVEPTTFVVTRNRNYDKETYTPTNVTTDRAFDADTVTITELADVVGTLIQDFQNAKALG